MRADGLFRWTSKQLWYVGEVRVQIAGVQQGLGGALGRAYYLDAEALLALEVLAGLHVVAVAGDEDVGVGVGRQAHHVHHYPHVPVTLVGDGALAVQGDGLVDLEGFGANLVAELVEVVDEGAGRWGALGVAGRLVADYVEGGAEEPAVADGRFE